MTWQNVDLSELIEVIESGGRPHGGATQDSGEIPSLGGENIRMLGGLELDEVKKVPVAFYEQLTKGILQNQDVLINKDGANTGKVGFYDGQFPKASINEHVFLLRGKPQKLEQLYLYYLLLSQNGQSFIRSKISGSAQPGLKRDFIKSFPVSIPVSTKEQAKIAEIFATIDRAITQTEALIAKHQRIKTGLMQDLLTRGIDEHGQLRDPSTHKFKSTPLGMIPEEWEYEQFGKYISSSAFGPRFPATQYDENGAIANIRTTDMDDEGNIVSEKLPRANLDLTSYEKHILKSGDILISRSGTIGITTVFSS